MKSKVGEGFELDGKEKILSRLLTLLAGIQKLNGH